MPLVWGLLLTISNMVFRRTNEKVRKNDIALVQMRPGFFTTDCVRMASLPAAGYFEIGKSFSAKTYAVCSSLNAKATPHQLLDCRKQALLRYIMQTNIISPSKCIPAALLQQRPVWVTQKIRNLKCCKCILFGN